MPDVPELVSWVYDSITLSAVRAAGADAVGLIIRSSTTPTAGFTARAALEQVRRLQARDVKTYVLLAGPVVQVDLARAARTIIEAGCAGASAASLSDFGVAVIVRKSLPDLPLFMSVNNPIATVGGAHQARELGFSRVTVSPFLSRDDVKMIAAQPGETEFCFAWPGCAPGIVHPDWPYHPQKTKRSFSHVIKLRGAALTALSLVVKPDDPAAAFGNTRALRLILDGAAGALEEAVSAYHQGQAGSIEMDLPDEEEQSAAQALDRDPAELKRWSQAEERLITMVSRFRIPSTPASPARGNEQITLRTPLEEMEEFGDWLWPDNLIVDLDEDHFQALKRRPPGGLEKQRVILAFPETVPRHDWRRMRTMADELLWSGYRRWLADDLDQFRFIRSLGVDEIWSGWNMPVSNKAAAALFAQLGCRASLVSLTMDRRGIESAPIWNAPLEPVLCAHARPVLRGTAAEGVPTEGDEAQFKILADTDEMCLLVPRRPYSLTHYLHAFRKSGLNHYLLDLRFDSMFQRNAHGVILAYQHVSSEPGGTTLVYQPRAEMVKKYGRDRGRPRGKDSRPGGKPRGKDSRLGGKPRGNDRRRAGGRGNVPRKKHRFICFVGVCRLRLHQPSSFVQGGESILRIRMNI